jgi:hypothetical protein
MTSTAIQDKEEPLEDYRAVFMSIVGSSKVAKKFYIPEYDSIRVLKYFVEEVHKKYPSVFPEEFKEINNDEFHDVGKLFKLSDKNLKMGKGSKFYLPAVSIPGMFQSLIEEIHRIDPKFPLTYEINESLKVMDGKPVLKEFFCKMQFNEKNSTEIVFYAKLTRTKSGYITFSANVGSWLYS